MTGMGERSARARKRGPRLLLGCPRSPATSCTHAEEAAVVAVAVVAVVHREVLRRRQRQRLLVFDIVLGAAASATVPALTLLLLLSGGAELPLGWGTLWQWLVMAAVGAVATPFVFSLMEACHRAFGYQPEVENSFRPDREIRHGKILK